MAAPIVTEAQKRTVACPKCKRVAGKPCRDMGSDLQVALRHGAADLATSHRERRAAYLAAAYVVPAGVPVIVSKRGREALAGRTVATIEPAPKCPGVDDAALASRAADLRASVGNKLLPGESVVQECPVCGGVRAHAPGCSRIETPIDLMGELRKALTGEGHFAKPAGQAPRIVIRVPAGPEPTDAQVQANVDAMLAPTPETIVPTSKMHPRAVHYIRRWSGVPADEAPLCGVEYELVVFDRTLVGETHDSAGQPMPICPKCAEIWNARAGL